jgi:hypothetical protein
MFKPVSGNSKYLISINGEITDLKGVTCTFPFRKLEIQIELYGKLRFVDPIWLGIVSNLGLTGEDIFDNVILKPVKKATEAIKGRMPVFISPVYYNEDYKVIPRYPNYAVSCSGKIVDIRSGEFITPYQYKPIENTHYPMVTLFDPLDNKNTRLSLHRLVALLWVPNDDYYTRGIINHKDGIKSNCDHSNLEWVTYTENAIHAFSEGLRTDNYPCKVLNIKTKEITEFPTIWEASRFMGLKHSVRLKNGFRFANKLINNLYELKLQEDFTPWVYQDRDSPIKVSKYTFTVTENNGNVVTLYGTVDTIKHYKLWNMASMSVECIVKIFKEKYPEHVMEVKENYPTRKVENTIYRCKTRCILATHPEQESIKFTSLRKAAEQFRIDRKTIQLRMRNGKDFESWNFKEINC